MIEDLYNKYLSCTGISTDTRKIDAGNIFFALKGPNFNANEFAVDALHKGASFVIIDDARQTEDEKTILVDDVLKTLQALANHHRKHLDIPILAITGSNGKTTTKELIRSVLSMKYKCKATEGNLNNHIGVPLTLLTFTKDTEIGIVEMGANKLGDIRELCGIAEPTHGIITNIGKAHTEGFGSFEGVIKGKTELYHWLIQHEGTVFINTYDEILNNMAKRFRDPITYPQAGDYYHCALLEVNPYVRMGTENGKIIQTSLVGAYNFPNLAAALCIGKYFEVEQDLANQSVAKYIPSNNRSQVLSEGSTTLILDAYNANPDSMKAALENLAKMEAIHKVVILGDMLELGDLTETEHRGIGKITKRSGFDEVIFCGERMRYAHEENNNSEYFASRQELENYLDNRNFKDCLILIKGSRAMALESVSKIILKS